MLKTHGMAGRVAFAELSERGDRLMVMLLRAGRFLDAKQLQSFQGGLAADANNVGSAVRVMHQEVVAKEAGV